MRRFPQIPLNFVVFLTGGAVLILEVTATRILAPHFGNTIFTVSSVISVVLAALSLGYYFGGRLADRLPSFTWFYSLISLSGVLVAGLHFLGLMLLPPLSLRLPLDFGPLLSSLLLFFLPSLILGTLSPYAVKLQESSHPGQGVGTSSGTVFFWSTLGSIAGSLATGFYLIPHYGINSIIFGTGIGLTILGLYGLTSFTRFSFFLAIFLAWISLRLPPQLPNTIYETDGLYEKIRVVDTQLNNHPARILLQDKSYGSGMYLDNPELVFEYTKYYRLYQLLRNSLSQVLVIGGGAYSVPKAILNENPQTNITVAEIDPKLLPLAQKYFSLPLSPRLTNYIGDGRRLLADSAARYDLIFADAYSSIYSVPSHLTTVEFFRLAKSRLAPKGIFIANFIGSLNPTSPSLTFSEITTFQSVFPHNLILAVESPYSYEIQNLIFAGSNSPFPDKEFTNRVNLDNISPVAYTKLTDDFAPTDYLTGFLLKSPPSISPVIQLITQQVNFGPRYAGTPGHTQTINLITTRLSSLSYHIKNQTWQHQGYEFTNLIAQLNPQISRRLLLAAHYDNKIGIPGANDSASGVAILLELARELPQSLPIGIDLIFFDAEEGEPRTNAPLIPLGSIYFSQHLKDIYPATLPQAGILIDMVCTANPGFYPEANSLQLAPDITNKFFNIASKKYPGLFFTQAKYAIGDDHLALNQSGIPTTLIIGWNYKHWHTADDTADKCRAKTLEAVKDSLLEFVSSF